VFYLPFLLPLLLEIACIVHAVKTERYIWIFIIFFIPGLGSLVYLAVEVIPDMLRSRHAAQFASNARTLADPGRSLRQAERAADMVGSVDSKRVLAEEYIERGRYHDAVALYEGMLVGQFKDDPVLLLGLARARLLNGDGAGAQASLDALQAADPKFQSEDAHMIYARALELQDKNDEALDEYKKLARYFAGQEAKCRYAMLLQKTGRTADARELFSEIVKSLDGAPRHYRRAQKEWGDIAKAALK
jgi:hypothetical protein